MQDFKQMMQQQDIETNNQNAVKVEESKAVAEIQASIMMAKKCPRNQSQSYIDIIDSCKRPSLAESALYVYPRGNKQVQGPSIRLAEVLARSWGNCRVGISILSQTRDKTEAKAFAYDMQTNYVVEQVFTVAHKRVTKKGTYALTDDRDIRELVQNIGSRMLRGCILRLIPSDIVDDAVEQVNKTLLSSDIPVAEQIKKMVTAFDELGVKVEHLEEFLGHSLNAVVPSQIVNLKATYRSIRDGVASREQFFNLKSTNTGNQVEELKGILSKNKKKDNVKTESKKEDDDVKKDNQ